MTMRMGGRLLALYAIVFAVVIGFRDQLDAWGVGTLAFGAMAPALAHIVEVTGSELKAYKPVSALDARIANEKIKLWIGTLNAVANALIIGGLAVPVVGLFTQPDTFGAQLPTENAVAFLVVAFGGYLHIRARNVLNALKDEQASPGTLSGDASRS